MPDTVDNDQLYNVNVAAGRLGFTSEHVRRLVRAGELGCVRVNRRIMFRPSHLAEFIDAHDVAR